MRFALLVLALATGCSWGSAPATDPCANGALDLNEGDVDCGETCGACPVNHACRTSADCGNGVCVEVVDPVRHERPGVCWASKGFSGCKRVPDGPQPCSSGLIPALCQWGYNSEMLKHCTPPVQDKSIPNVVCCDASMWSTDS